jgi:K+-transporting ATPase KdpF subunit
LDTRISAIAFGEPMNIETIAVMTISVLLMVYLLYALLRPEKF